MPTLPKMLEIVRKASKSKRKASEDAVKMTDP